MSLDSPAFWLAVAVQTLAMGGALWRFASRMQRMEDAIRQHATSSAERATSTEKALDALVRQDVHRVELDALRSRVERLEAA